jgi:hypothetical protein
MISLSADGSFDSTERWLRSLQKLDISKIVQQAAQRGVDALARATPKESGRAASSWSYEVVKANGSITIGWKNSDIENGYPVALMIQYGHGTGTGGWIQGRDFINPAMRPIFDEIAETVWKAVTSA